LYHKSITNLIKWNVFGTTSVLIYSNGMPFPNTESNVFPSFVVISQQILQVRLLFGLPIMDNTQSFYRVYLLTEMALQFKVNLL
jgi:hypothetical protein